MTWMRLVAFSVALQACDAGEPATRRVDPTRPIARGMDAPRYEATFADGVQFWKPGVPLFVADMNGVSAHEPWGRWTDGPEAVVTFTQPLPTRFTVVVTAAAYGPNVAQPATFVVGSVVRTAIFDTELGRGAPDVRRIRFDTAGQSDRLEIRPFRPMRPYNGDKRALGLALIRLQIESH